jgi:hypothetical protein
VNREDGSLLFGIGVADCASVSSNSTLGLIACLCEDSRDLNISIPTIESVLVPPLSFGEYSQQQFNL